MDEEHIVPEVAGREHAARSASSYPNVGTSGTGTAPRESLRQPLGAADSAGGSDSGGGGGYPNVGSTGLGTAPKDHVYVRCGRTGFGHRDRLVMLCGACKCCQVEIRELQKANLCIHIGRCEDQHFVLQLRPPARAHIVDSGYANVGTTGLGTAPAERVRPPPGIRQSSSGSSDASHERRVSTGSVPSPPPQSVQCQPVPQRQVPSQESLAGSKQQHQAPPQQQQQQQRPESQPAAQQPPQRPNQASAARPVCPKLPPGTDGNVARYCMFVISSTTQHTVSNAAAKLLMQAQQQQQQTATACHAAPAPAPTGPLPSTGPQPPAQQSESAMPPYSTVPVVTRSGALRLHLQASLAIRWSPCWMDSAFDLRLRPGITALTCATCVISWFI